LRSRAALVRARATLVNHLRGGRSNRSVDVCLAARPSTWPSGRPSTFPPKPCPP
jgi:hypothetical protein